MLVLIYFFTMCLMTIFFMTIHRRLSLYYESSGGHPSQWSGRATTLPLAVPSPIPEVVARASTSDPTSAYVEFERPADDGGSAILGYVNDK